MDLGNPKDEQAIFCLLEKVFSFFCETAPLSMCVSLAQALFKTRLCEQQLLSFLAEVFIRPFSQRWPLAPRPLPPVWVHWHSMGVPASFQRLFLLNALEQVPQHLLHLLPAWRQKTNQRKHLKGIKKIYIYYIYILCRYMLHFRR